MQKFTLFIAAILILGGTTFGQETLENYSIGKQRESTIIAGSSVPDSEAPGGFGASENFPKSTLGQDLPANTVSLVVQPDFEIPYGNYKGLRLLLANTTDSEVWFTALDSRLKIIQEAKDTDGAWKPIEALPTSWCGNSFHRVRLGANEYWQLLAPRYHGNFKTMLRFRMSDFGKTDVYSNEFEGSINRGQFIPIKNRFTR